MNKNFLSNFVDSSQYWKFLKIFENPVLVSYKKVSYKKKSVYFKLWPQKSMKNKLWHAIIWSNILLSLDKRSRNQKDEKLHMKFLG